MDRSTHWEGMEARREKADDDRVEEGRMRIHEIGCIGFYRDANK